MPSEPLLPRLAAFAAQASLRPKSEFVAPINDDSKANDVRRSAAIL
jgi:hypothetical protein